MNQTTLKLEKLTCPSCMQKIKNTISGLNGVEKINIIFQSSKARVIFDEALISEEEIIRHVVEVGYGANPDIWILDEPMTGLDPQAAYDLKQLMRNHAEAGNIVLFSTHNLENAEELCDEIVILRKGEVLYNGTIEDLQAQNENESLETIYLKIAGRDAQNQYVQRSDEIGDGE